MNFCPVENFVEPSEERECVVVGIVLGRYMPFTGVTEQSVEVRPVASDIKYD